MVSMLNIIQTLSNKSGLGELGYLMTRKKPAACSFSLGKFSIDLFLVGRLVVKISVVLIYIRGFQAHSLGWNLESADIQTTSLSTSLFLRHH